MTVLIAAGTAEGTAIAADGHRMNANLEILTGNGQKIWRNRSTDHWDLAVGWAGSTCLEAGAVCFSFPRASREIWRTLTLGELPDSFHEFAKQMRTELQAFLEAFVNPYPSKIPSSSIRAGALIGTHLGDVTICASMTFFVENGQAQSTEPIVETLIGGYAHIQSGSGFLWENRPQIDPSTLTEAIEDAREFVQACIDGRGTIPTMAVTFKLALSM